MDQQRPAEVQPWMLFAFPAAIAVPIIAGILLGGPVFGFLLAGLVAVVIVAVAVRMRARRVEQDRRSRRGASRPRTGAGCAVRQRGA